LSLKERLDGQVIEKIVNFLEALEFGTIQITVHDSQITQIDRLEKYRFPLQKKSDPQVIANRSN
jgi:hypothetical protein